ncbi:MULTISPECIES: hypothetical protein [Dyadobacter]|uniref:Uncharacterized protein n=1 Tax=Dyadobacter chenhuakuii TaxID=2909339 RepID=A0A9X1QC62_9BACT|nr:MULTISPECIES: hypothetical protein [Dyadobacter]MCF2492467.1 hypothetical protein [Dyadobacter chenhuakuii]MCF2497119.1 hypothetical protein [Dyadobacter chenhuakuii]MCF2520513.1 hypothetical protein [Dyadobacter sp. CY351]USJ33233.1 hypothetical protein NFI80_10865 [Dyadobacter chenhuakuii]
MNADRRLDQLEPVISELLIKQDRTDKKVDNLTFMVSNITELVITQNENITFLLKNQLQMSGRIGNIEIRLDGMDSQFKDVLSNQDSLKAAQSLISEKQEAMFITQESMSAKQDFLSRMQESMLTEQQMISAKQDFLSRMQETILAKQDLILDFIKKE